jgi:hypothetical protein
MKRVLSLIAVFVITLLLCLLVGCSYTHPSIADPDLVERISNGHVICYYKTGPGRGYAKCCEDCPMHTDGSATITKQLNEAKR